MFFKKNVMDLKNDNFKHSRCFSSHNSIKFIHSTFCSDVHQLIGPLWVTKIFTLSRGLVGIPYETPKLATSTRGSVEATREYPVPLGLAGFGLINDKLLFFQISCKASYKQIPSVSEEMY